jgi:acyl carrier protein phosphodiesterase
MNHLAHCFLSLGDEDLLTGNFIGDDVKGNDWKNYPEGVQQGIILHRTIDSFTDNHPMTGRSKERIRAFTGRYAPPVIDILYDHLLAIHWAEYSNEPFDEFAVKVYKRLKNRAEQMPEPVRQRLPHMLAGRFLHGYQSRAGLMWVLERFNQRLGGKMDTSGLSDHFFATLPRFSDDFAGFFPDLIHKVKEQTGKL